MVETPRWCVLQWAGHAGYVTERFSGLFARQALVDVTLVCEEQKLRVHKLVLASNSIYFEEILQQDLGQEPVIFLKDLNFEILKAMVEFMYCGETTIPHQLLPSLLTATRTFKVKELESVIDVMMSSNISPDGLGRGTNVVTSACNDTDHVRVKHVELEKHECKLLCDQTNSDMNASENQSLESNNIPDSTENELEHTLYEEAEDIRVDEKQVTSTFAITVSSKMEENKSAITSQDHKAKGLTGRCSESSMISDNSCSTDDELKPILYEQCCDLSDIDECEKSSISLSRSCLQEIEKDFAQYSIENTDVPSKVGKCIKVYTHKRRRSVDEVKNKLPRVDNVIPDLPSTDCIDLLEEPSSNDIPVTLLTSLDMESAEYIISLSAENIQTIVGATMSDQHTLIKCKDIKELVDYDSQKENVSKKEPDTENAESCGYAKPILRRSLRLNQQESEEANNESTKESTAGEKQLKKSYSQNATDLCVKGKRKIKDVDRKLPNASINCIAKKNVNNSRNPKNTTKLIVKKNNKSASAVSNKEKYEHKVKGGSKPKCEGPDKMEIDTFVPAKLNTIKHINRALWGDMSDVSDDFENNLDLSEYAPHTEIPFAVGLLPLRTALEKMQATPDYQPRKTRSSVAPIKHDINNFKRKGYSSVDSHVATKKQHTVSDPKDNANTVCHIEIRTAPSQYIRNRKKFLATNVTTLQSPTVMNRQ